MTLAEAIRRDELGATRSGAPFAPEKGSTDLGRGFSAVREVREALI